MKNVSVIIPVYNAGKFVEKAITSAIEQPETAEVILIEDGSDDDSLAICRVMADKYSNISLIENRVKINKGGGISRNAGVQHAVQTYIAFLDADDYFLPGRFRLAEEILGKNSDIDGVYEAVGTDAKDNASLERHLRRVGTSMGKADPMLTTLDIKCSPEDLFEVLLFGEHGFFHFNGLTLRKSVFSRIPFLDAVQPVYGIGNDQDFFNRLTANAMLVPGRLNEPVAMRCIYEGNATLSIYVSENRRKKNNYTKHLQCCNLFRMMLNKAFSKRANRLILRMHLEYYNEYYIQRNSKIYRKMLKLINLIKLFMRYPKLVFKVI